MIRWVVGRGALGRTAMVLLLLGLATSTLQSQTGRSPAEADSAARAGLISGTMIDALPVDSVAGALLLAPGVGPALGGGLSLRGSAGGEAAMYLDGIPVTPGGRVLRLFPPTNSVAEAAIRTGPLSAAIGNASAGAIMLRSKAGRGARLGFESDAPFGAASLGRNRLEGSLGADIGRHLSLFAGGALTGQKSAEPGFGARAAPIFTQAGVDTTVLVGARQVDVFNYAVSRGSCDMFAASANAGIADNYGQSCQGDRTPLSAQSRQELLLKAEYGRGNSRIGILALRDRDQARLFDYRTSYLASNAFARSTTSSLLALTLTHQLKGDGVVHASLSRQSDRALTGPLSAEGELATRDPRLGLMIRQLKFQYDFTSFPVNQELVDNYRNNIAGSRRSPYDLDNPSRYATISQFRSNAYGATGFVEGGGPVGLLALYREHRTVAAADAAWQVSRNSRFLAGAELIRYGVDNYTHQLTSSAGSDVYIVAPTAVSLFAEDAFGYGKVTLILGVRYDRFSSNADRPFVLDTVAASPTFNTYQPFPRISSYDGTFQGQPLVTTVRDARRSALSPRFRLVVGSGSPTELRVGYARQAQLPDFGALYAGINTDLAITNSSQLFGSNLDFEKSWIAEAGLLRRLDAATVVDLAVFARKDLNAVVGRLVPLPDPTRHNSQIDVRQFVNEGSGRSRGAEITLSRRIGPISGHVGYAYQRVTTEAGVSPDSRPHTLSGALAFQRRRTGAFAAFRIASGASYTPCELAGNESALSGGLCARGGLIGTIARGPTTRQLDLRITRSIRAGSRPITAYIDARNLFNFRNVVQVFAATGAITSPIDRQMVYAVDSSNVANEAKANSLYRPDGAVDLTFGGAGHSGCAGYVSSAGSPAAPSCISLIRAEERFGNGDGVFDLAEQTRASDAHYAVARGEQAFTTAPRRIRAGIQIGL